MHASPRTVKQRRSNAVCSRLGQLVSQSEADRFIFPQEGRLRLKSTRNLLEKMKLNESWAFVSIKRNRKSDNGRKHSRRKRHLRTKQSGVVVTDGSSPARASVFSRRAFSSTSSLVRQGFGIVYTPGSHLKHNKKEAREDKKAKYNKRKEDNGGCAHAQIENYFNSSKDKQGDETDTTKGKMYSVLRVTVNRGFLYCFGIRGTKLIKTVVACSSNSVKPARLGNSLICGPKGVHRKWC
ncbi:hypothetical protein ElyMa_002603500 [Elysia marginata]|uniref:Uncharacterized protein n=1 Tax=Elysia marginata TaxID=1093978 RepID=A0AAV4H134_9GAST|nr:hypothetical protein ElyMa_002603500 [Elysia marginata]